MKDRIFESKEDYLETILILHNRNGEVRSVDIAAEMDFSKPSDILRLRNRDWRSRSVYTSGICCLRAGLPLWAYRRI